MAMMRSYRLPVQNSNCSVVYHHKRLGYFLFHAHVSSRCIFSIFLVNTVGSLLLSQVFWPLGYTVLFAAEVILRKHYSSVASLFLQQKHQGCWGSHTSFYFLVFLCASPRVFHTCNSAFTCHWRI